MSPPSQPFLMQVFLTVRHRGTCTCCLRREPGEVQGDQNAGSCHCLCWCRKLCCCWRSWYCGCCCCCCYFCWLMLAEAATVAVVVGAVVVAADDPGTYSGLFLMMLANSLCAVSRLVHLCATRATPHWKFVTFACFVVVGKHCES